MEGLHELGVTRAVVKALKEAMGNIDMGSVMFKWDGHEVDMYVHGGLRGSARDPLLVHGEIVFDEDESTYYEQSAFRTAARAVVEVEVRIDVKDVRLKEPKYRY